ncbi:xylulokinase [[Clostridium] hylemonae]|uniref:xylulokinase n=1 Tax=[Clostridium] hylemonae TaxID=89153 RepID=UPI0011069EF6|nr:xylulokinase [[Clostridium] hylemonae]
MSGAMEQYLLGIDIGTSACKVAVFDENGQVKAGASGAYNVYYPHPGWAEQNPEEWWQAVCSAVKAAMEKSGIRPGSVAGIGIDGQSWSAIPIDAEGKVLANTPIWMDTRAAGICEETGARVGEKRIFDVCGNPFKPSYSTPKVLWYKEQMPDVYRKTDKILQSNSYIAFKLTGEVTQELTQGYGHHCFCMRQGTWDMEMCRDLGIDPDMLPAICASHDVIGTVTAKAAKECGLMEGIPVVAGALDAACGTLGAGAVHPGETQEQGGQAGGMSICMDTYKADERLILSFHAVPGQWILQGGTVGGGGVMRWLEHEFADYERMKGKETGKSSLELFNELAGEVPAGSDGVVFLPYMSGERSPIWDPDAKGVYYGLDFSKTKGHFIRAAMEGVAFSLRHNLDVAEQAGASVSELRSMGGSANSLLWTQIKADVTGKRIVVPSSDTATTLGAVILAGVGVGMYKSFGEAVKKTVAEKRYHEPDPDTQEVYTRNYKVYRKLYENLKAVMKGDI